MQNSYKVGVQNRFALLSDEDAEPFSNEKHQKPQNKKKQVKPKNKSKPAIAKTVEPPIVSKMSVPPHLLKVEESIKPAAAAPAGPAKAKKPNSKLVPPKKLTVGVPEETMISMEDYMKTHCIVRKKPNYNLRLAGEGEDLSQWKNLVPLHNKKNSAAEEMSPVPLRGIEKPLTPEPKIQRPATSRKKHLDIPVRFEHSLMRRLRQRPPCSCQDAEPAKETQIPPKVDDDRDFPSLG